MVLMGRLRLFVTVRVFNVVNLSTLWRVCLGRLAIHQPLSRVKM